MTGFWPKKNLLLFILIVLAFLTRFLFLSYPSEVVFDEVHFGKFVAAYSSGKYYFDIHPPLGKLMIAGFCKLLGEQVNFDFEKIGEAFSARTLFILRFLPALAGSLFIILIYELILTIGLSKKTALLGSFLILLDNAILVESKFILTDIFLLFFGFASIFFFLKARSKNYFYVLAGIFAGLSFSIKWTGLSFLGIILFFSLIELIKNFKFKTLLLKSVYLILVPFLIYLFVFFIHFELLPKSGPGDAYMSAAFQMTLQGNKITGQQIKPLSLWGKFIELNKAMYSYSANLKTGHPNASYFYQWPLMKKPIWYWNKKINESSANIYLFGNPITWWLVTLFLPISLFLSQVKKIERRVAPLFYFLFFGYLINILPFIFVKRATFLYHYLPALVFGILILILFIEKIFLAYQLNLSCKYLIGFLIFVSIIFLLVSPISYGFFLPEKINLYYLKIIGFFN